MTRNIADDKINLRLILVCGKTSDFLFPSTYSAADVAQYVFDHWPSEWEDERVQSASLLKLIYHGRFLHGNVTLGDAENCCLLRLATKGRTPIQLSAVIRLVRRRALEGDCLKINSVDTPVGKNHCDASGGQKVLARAKLARCFPEAMSLRVMVGVKRVIDYAAKVRVKTDKSGVITEGVKHSMNPFDEIAVEEALRLREKQIAAEVLAVSCGPPVSQEVLRHALALGADRAIHVEVDPKQYQVMEPLHVAKALSRIAADEKIDLIILGKQAIDDDSNQTGQMVAALLDWPQALFASKVEQDGAGWFKITREVDTGTEVVRVKLPAVITTDLRLNEPRYATLPNIMKSKKKPLLKKAISELDVKLEPHQEIMEVVEPRKREAGELVSSVDDLISKLRKSGVLA